MLGVLCVARRAGIPYGIGSRLDVAIVESDLSREAMAQAARLVGKTAWARARAVASAVVQLRVPVDYWSLGLWVSDPAYAFNVFDTVVDRLGRS